MDGRLSKLAWLLVLAATLLAPPTGGHRCVLAADQAAGADDEAGPAEPTGGLVPRKAPDDGQLQPEDRPVVPSRAKGALEVYGRTLLALALVVGLIFLVRYVIARAKPSRRRPGRGRPLQVIYRTQIGLKRHLILIRMGRRLILAGSGPAGLSALSEVRDEEEVAELLAEAQAGRLGPLAGILAGGEKTPAGQVQAGDDGGHSGSAEKR